MCGNSQRSLDATAAEGKITLRDTIRDGEPDMALSHRDWSKGQSRPQQLYGGEPRG